MNERNEQIMSQIRLLEAELIQEAKTKEAEFCYSIHNGAVRFTDAARVGHKNLVTQFHRYVLHSRFLVLLTSPLIWMCVIPISLADLVGTIYQAICFPVYGIPKVPRRDYLAFDRHHLAYLNTIEKLNCEYCAYVNGILAYFTEIAARTEQHWCPIKHAGCVKCAHSRYKRFVDFGDAKQYRTRVEEIRRSFQDIKETK
ncbi:MAG TPA: hypothetical protein VGG34_11615 [Opitutaceae bacterium]|jgi:hypothetical protein